MSDDDSKIVDWVHFERSRQELGAGFIRILSYFREDGAKSVDQIEEAMHEENTAALVVPAHTKAHTLKAVSFHWCGACHSSAVSTTFSARNTRK